MRAAREVISPNVCRVFDLQELDGQELVSMEYIDGVTLHEILTERSPLPLNEAREIAVQFLAGLEAIHEAGLVHRDIKPENVMRTRTGRVVVMDFGIAKGLREGRGGVIAGTPAYMAPEQARGEGLDARADIFSAGVMLAEMVASGGTHSLADRKRIWRDVRRVPPEVSATPWAKLILKAVAASPEQRFPSAAALTRALEEVTLRAAGDEDIDPYPGLAPFDTDRAKYFYGRELEVEALWKKLRRPHLLALIAPSGSGKSSFLRAGVLATLPEGWSAILVTPGPHPFAALARAVGQQLEPSHHQQESVDLEQQEVAIERIANWRQRHRHALLIVDQFEELFTQSTDETQTRFADFLGRLPIEADTFVLLSMREDFLYHCQPYEPLAPVFTELMPLGALSGNSLRRALVQPALRCGYRFGDEALVDEMVETVSHERAALPLLAFAASRLWQLRDREEGLLTRRAYEQIGGVGGALAQHAEATLERIGLDQVSIVRELFRNLVTSQGTRAARDRDELLSVFKLADGPARRRRFSGERGAWSGEATETEGPTPATGASATAARVLDELIDARLLTSYEVPAAEEGDTPGHKIEIIHESLLSSWPRLVRWRTQDTEGAQLRDELRHQAKVWRDRGRPEDLLWTGTSYREFSLWRERYPGGLTAAEEEFAQAMVARAGRQRRRRRVAIATAFTLLLIVLAVVGVSRQQAVAAARRAEAQKLLALAQVQLETSPTVALAYATSSLELFDTPEGRTFLLQALAAGPPARVLPAGDGDQLGELAFSPDGARASIRGFESLRVFSRDGATDRRLEPFPAGRGSVFQAFDSTGRYLFGAKNEELRVWSLPGLEFVERQVLAPGRTFLAPGPAGIVTVLKPDEGGMTLYKASIGRPLQEIDRIESDKIRIDRSGRWLAYPSGDQVLMRSLENWSAPPHIVGAPHDVRGIGDFVDDRIATWEGGQIRVWSTRPGATEPVRTLPPTEFETNDLAFDPSRPRLAVASQASDGPRIDVWDLEAPADAVARSFLGTLPGTEEMINEIAFDPTGSWLAAAAGNAVAFWPLAREAPWVLIGHPWQIWDLSFTPDGRHLVSRDQQGIVMLWDLAAGGESQVLAKGMSLYGMLDIDREGRFVALSQRGGVAIVPLDGGPTRNLEGFRPDTLVVPVAVNDTGRLIAAGARNGPRDDKVIRVWDLESGKSWTLGPTDDAGDGYQGQFGDLAFLPDGSLLSAGESGVRLWSVTEGTNRHLGPSLGQSVLAVFDGGRSVAYITGTLDAPEPNILDLETGVTRPIPSHAGSWDISVDRSGTLLASGGGWTGVARIGAMSSEEPHLLVGHERGGAGALISPDGRWVATGGADRTIRLWPMPDVSQPPLHTLPYDDLLAKLRSLTNLAVVPDEESSTGWRVEVGPFPGWAEVPTW